MPGFYVDVMSFLSIHDRGALDRHAPEWSVDLEWAGAIATKTRSVNFVQDPRVSSRGGGDVIASSPVPMGGSDVSTSPPATGEEGIERTKRSALVDNSCRRNLTHGFTGWNRR